MKESPNTDINLSDSVASDAITSAAKLSANNSRQDEEVNEIEETSLSVRESSAKMWKFCFGITGIIRSHWGQIDVEIPNEI